MSLQHRVCLVRCYAIRTTQRNLARQPSRPACLAWRRLGRRHWAHALKSTLDVSAARAVHTGTTSQDVIDTAMVLTCLSALDEMTDRLTRLVAGFDAVLKKSGDNAIMARTRMQAALPASVVLRIDALHRPLVDHLALAADARTQISVVQIGGSIGSRETPQPLIASCAGQVAETLGLSLGPVCHADRSRKVAFGHWLTLVAGSLGKIGQDVALIVQQGIDDIGLSGGGGLSAMAEATGVALLHAESLIASIEGIGASD